MGAVWGKQRAQRDGGLLRAGVGIAIRAPLAYILGNCSAVEAQERPMTRYGLAWIFAVGMAAHIGATPAVAATPEDAWPALAQDVFKGRPLADGSGLVA